MISLAFGATVLDEHTRLACLETNAPLLAAIDAAVRRHSTLSPSHLRHRGDDFPPTALTPCTPADKRMYPQSAQQWTVAHFTRHRIRRYDDEYSEAPLFGICLLVYNISSSTYPAQ